jgi:ribosomal-protein-alanine N-acetyltransferase
MTVARMRLESAATAVRPFTHRDADELTELVVANRHHTAPWDPIRPERFYSRAGQVEQLRRDHAAWETGTGYAFAVLDRGGRDRIIGRVALANVVRGAWRNATLGYWIAADAASRGHGTAAVRLVLAFAFEYADLHRIQPAIIPRNGPSIRLATKAGFRHEGRALRYLEINGVWEDHEIFAMTAEEWDGQDR